MWKLDWKMFEDFWTRFFLGDFGKKNISLIQGLYDFHVAMFFAKCWNTDQVNIWLVFQA